MYKLITLAVLALAGTAPAQAASAAKAPVILFTAGDCGQTCANVRSMLKFRHVDFKEMDVNSLDGPPGRNKYGVTVYPSTLIGNVLVAGDDLMVLTSILAETLGKGVLTQEEQQAMAGHFDKQGRPKVVLYGTGWCGYCKKERALLRSKNIAFDDIDVEASAPAAIAYTALRGTGFPLTYVGYRRFSGFRNEELLAAVNELAGKAKTRVR